MLNGRLHTIRTRLQELQLNDRSVNNEAEPHRLRRIFKSLGQESAQSISQVCTHAYAIQSDVATPLHEAG